MARLMTARPGLGEVSSLHPWQEPPGLLTIPLTIPLAAPVEIVQTE
jgi:hypothetical protein